MSFVNNDSFLASIIGSVIGGLMTLCASLLSFYLQRKNEEKRDLLRKFEQKGEFFVETNVEDDGTIPQIDIVFTDYIVKKEPNGIDFVIPHTTKNNRNMKGTCIYLRNGGKSAINEIHICVTCPEKYMLIPEKSVSYYSDKGIANYSILCDQRIPVGKLLCVHIKYNEKCDIINPIVSPIEIVFVDNLYECYAQPIFPAIFPEKARVYEARRITWKEYNHMTRNNLIINQIENRLNN